LAWACFFAESKENNCIKTNSGSVKKTLPKKLEKQREIEYRHRTIQ
jgi:hypothetical protein